VKDDMDELGLHSEWLVFRDMCGEALNREKRLTLAEGGSVVNWEYYDVFGCV